MPSLYLFAKPQGTLCLRGLMVDSPSALRKRALSMRQHIADGNVSCYCKSAKDKAVGGWRPTVAQEPSQGRLIRLKCQGLYSGRSWAEFSSGVADCDYEQD